MDKPGVVTGKNKRCIMRKFRQWAKDVNLFLSVLKITIGVIIGVATAIPAMYVTITKSVEAAMVSHEGQHFISTRYKIETITKDIREYPDDLTVLDLEYILDEWELLRKEHKTPGLKAKIKNIQRFYDKILAEGPQVAGRGNR